MWAESLTLKYHQLENVRSTLQDNGFLLSKVVKIEHCIWSVQFAVKDLQARAIDSSCNGLFSLQVCSANIFFNPLKMWDRSLCDDSIDFGHTTVHYYHIVQHKTYLHCAIMIHVRDVEITIFKLQNFKCFQL